MPMDMSAGRTPKVCAISGKAVVMTVASSISMKKAPATSQATPRPLPLGEWTAADAKSALPEAPFPLREPGPAFPAAGLAPSDLLLSLPGTTSLFGKLTASPDAWRYVAAPEGAEAPAVAARVRSRDGASRGRRPAGSPKL
jgi:hypothetical protein